MKKNIVILIISLPALFACKGKMFRAPSAAMEETIMTGEIFYVSKTSVFKRNDIVVFNYFGEDYTTIDKETGKYRMEWQKWTKRLVAWSGDVIEIKDADVFVNENLVPDPPESLSEYDVFSVVDIDDFPEREGWPVPLLEKKGNTLHYFVLLTSRQAADYSQKKPAVLTVAKRVVTYESRDTFLAKSCVACEWTVDNYGPLRIPAPGDTVVVDSINFKLYRNIPQIQLGKNIIKEKLYFVMGDYRHASQDSRYTGFISHSKMYGVVK
jgi:signal peptidase I